MSLLAEIRNQIWQDLWKHYIGLVPDAGRIETALRAKGDIWQEDHVAFRTLPGAHTGASILQGIFEALGYVRRDDYHFEQKQLKAFWLQPDDVAGKHSAEVAPKIFVSELIPDRFSKEFQEIIKTATSQVIKDPLVKIRELAAETKAGHKNAGAKLREECVKYLNQGPSWRRPTTAEYEVLRKESEYASWTLVFGSRINHFTVSAHLMKSFSSLASLNDYLVSNLKIAMNEAGGHLIKGTPELRLEQSATLAANLAVLFQDGVLHLPYAFTEFAFRFPLEGKTADGQWQSYYQGFVTDNADKIFESTNQR